MMRTLLIAAMGILAAPATAATSRSIESEIRRVEARQEATWNAHDSVAYAALFAADADVVNLLGWH